MDNIHLLEQVFQKIVYFRSKKGKVNITMEFCIYELVYNHMQKIWKFAQVKKKL